MGHTCVFYGAIQEIEGRSTPDDVMVRIRRANDAAIAALGDGDRGFPPLCASMFRAAPDLVTYRSRVFSFAATFNGITSPESDEGWISRFEALLSNMYWEHASVVGYPDVGAAAISTWRPLPRDWRAWFLAHESELPPPITEWDRILAPLPGSHAPAPGEPPSEPWSPTCPWCNVRHVWGLVRTPRSEHEIRHGCRSPDDGSRMRCSACGRVFFIEAGRDGQVRLLRCQQPKWFEIWI